MEHPVSDAATHKMQAIYFDLFFILFFILLFTSLILRFLIGIYWLFAQYHTTSILAIFLLLYRTAIQHIPQIAALLQIVCYSIGVETASA